MEHPHQAIYDMRIDLFTACQDDFTEQDLLELQAELAEQAAALKKDMEARNTYQENLIELNKVAGHRARSTLVLGK